MKQYQYVLMVRAQSKGNKSSLHHVERRTHRHGFGRGWRLENKGFFDPILISNVHSLAAFFYDWATESLFVSLMKHIEGYVPDLNYVCVCTCFHFICMYLLFWWARTFFFGILDFHWQGYGAIASEAEMKEVPALCFPSI